MVLDVVPNLKTLLGSPFASNKIAGHPERPQGGERRLLSPLAPGLNNCVQLVPLNHQLSLGPSPGLAGPQLATIFTLCRMPCLPPMGYSVWAPRGLGDRSASHKPLLCSQETCPSPAGVFGEAVTHRLWLHSGKTRVPCRSFPLSFP